MPKFDWLKKFGLGAEHVALDIGPAVATATLGPAAGNLANFAAQAILAAQAKHADPAARKQEVQAAIATAAPAILTQILPPGAEDVQDPAMVAEAFDTLVEGIVKLFKGAGSMPAAPAAVPVPAVESGRHAPEATLTKAEVVDRAADGSLTIAVQIHVIP